MKKEFLKTSLILMIYTLIAGIALALVYQFTESRIAEAELENIIKSMEFLLTDEAGNQIVSAKDIKDIVVSKRGEMGKELYNDSIGTVISPVYDFSNNNVKYFVLTGHAVGYGGKVLSMVAFKYDGNNITLHRIKVLDYSQETPGLGAKIAESKIQERFYPISEDGLEKGVKVDKDAGKQSLDPENAKAEGVVKVSDVMTGATITPRAVANSINAMYKYLKDKYLAGGEN
ncbi:MAG: RnfABCDGE type electron transport complex subunit G [Fervidobacterium sp.]